MIDEMKTAVVPFALFLIGFAPSACGGGTSVIGTALEGADAGADQGVDDAAIEGYVPQGQALVCGSECSDCLPPPALSCVGHCSFFRQCTTEQTRCD